MRRFVLWIAALLIAFVVGVGANWAWWHSFARSPQAKEVERFDVDIPAPQREIVFVPAAPSPPPPPAPQVNLILDFDPEKFSLSAAFYIMGSKSKAFEDVHSLEVIVNAHSEQFPGSMSVVTKKNDKYDITEATFGLVADQRIFFATSELANSDYAYRFDGKILRTDFDLAVRKKMAVLRGTLTKMRKGRTIARQGFTFRMEYLGC